MENLIGSDAGIAAAAEIDFLAEYPFKPYGYYRDLDPVRLADHFRAVMLGAEKRPDVRTWTLDRGRSPVALAQLEPLEWDTRMLGRPAARVNWLIASGDYQTGLERKRQLLDRLLEDACRRGVEHLTARVAANDPSSIHALQSRGFVLLDSIVTFSRPSTAPADPSGGVAVRLWRSGDLESLRRIAASSFSCDRYHADPEIPNEVADRLHADWIENSCRGFADAVLVAELEELPGGVAGFTTVKIDRPAAQELGVRIAAIVLVATDQRARGRGIGGMLTGAAIEWCRTQAVHIVEVGTQLRNVRACRLYAAMGFQIVDGSVSLRWAISPRDPSR